MSGEETIRRAKPNAIDRIEGFILFAFSAAVTAFVTSGRYISFVTPRTMPYLWFAALVLLALSIAAWFGAFQCTQDSLGRILIVAVLPTLLLSLPLDSANASTTGANRAIAINASTAAALPGLDTAAKTITIRDDDFGSWFDRIDRHSEQYLGYTVIVEGFVSRDSSLGPSQFSTSRMLMTCCVLDMTPFGLVTDTSAIPKALPSDKAWVRVTGTIAKGRIGTASHGYDGLIVKAKSVHAANETPNGYFYR